MIGRDQVEHPLLQRLAERRAMARLTDRRRALVLGRSIGNVVGRKGQVMRTGFRRDRDSGVFGRRNRVYRFGRRDVDNVNARAGFAGIGTSELRGSSAARRSA